MLSNYDTAYEYGSDENGCRLWDGHNNCCMLDRIERIIAYFYEEGLNTIKWGERRV